MNLKEISRIQKVLKEVGYFDISRISKEIYTHFTENDIPLDRILERIAKQEPWEYIRGFCEFRGINFKVTEDTLIPRIETEQIIDISIDLIKKNRFRNIIDVGTGTGCIIISLATEILKERKVEKDTKFYAIDISKKALNIAKENANTVKLDKIITFRKGDLTNGFKLKDSTLIIANLPYIPSAMYKRLDRSVKGYEPKLALEGGDDGLLYYKKLFDQIRKSKKDIQLLIEIEPLTLENLKTYTTKQEFTISFKDYRGLNRFVLLHFS